MYTWVGPTFFYGAPGRDNSAYTRAPTTPIPFLQGGSGLVHLAPALTEAQAAQEILSGTMTSLCGDEPGRTVFIWGWQSLQAVPGPSNSSVVRDTLPEEENGTRFSLGVKSPPPIGSPDPLQSSIKQFSPREFRTQLSPHRLYIPVVKYLAKAHTVFLVDDSKHMAPFWLQMRDCITRCISTIINEAETDYVPSRDYFPYGDGQEEEDLFNEDNWEEFPTMSLQFLNSPLSLRSITYAEKAFQTFNSFTPHIGQTPLGTRISEVLADLFPEPRPGTKDEIPIHIIIPTAGYATEKPQDTIGILLRELNGLRLSDDKISITMFQVGSDPGAAARLEAYEIVYNSWGTQRDLVYFEHSGTGLPGAIGSGATSPRKMLRAVSRGLELRGSI